MKFGIVGYGRMGKLYHKVLSEMDIKVDFITDTIKPKKIDCQYFTNYKDAINKTKVDGVVVSTYAPSHHEIIKYAIEKKIKYIACEKPFTTSIRHADEIIQKLANTDIRLSVNYSRRFSTAYESLKKTLYSDNLIGLPKSIIITSGAGGLSALGTHFFDLCSLLFDEKVDSVFAIPIDKKLPNPRGKEFEDPGGYVILNFDNEKRAYIDMSDDLGVQHIIEIICEYGRIRIDEINKTINIRSRSVDDRTKPKHLYILPNLEIKNDTFQLEKLEEFLHKMLQNLLSNSKLIFNANLAREKVEIYSAIRKSFITKQLIKLPITNEFYEKEFMVT